MTAGVATAIELACPACGAALPDPARCAACGREYRSAALLAVGPFFHVFARKEPA